MNSKSKLIISVTALAVVLVIAVVAVVSVFAAVNASVTSSFTINYEAQNIKTNIDVKREVVSTIENVTASDLTKVGSVTFEGTEAEGPGTSKNVDAIEVKLTSTNKYCVIAYVFENTSTTVDYTLSAAVVPTLENATVTYYTSTEASSMGSIVANLTGPVTVEAGTSFYAYAVFEITDVTKDARASGSFAWTLTAVED